MKLYKIVGTNGEPLNGGHGDWPLPQDGQPGAWRAEPTPIAPCRVGLHLTDAEHLMQWAPGTRGEYGPLAFVVYRAEVDTSDGEQLVKVNGDKWVASRVRLLPRREPMPTSEDIGEVYRRSNAARRKAERARARVGPVGGYAARIVGTALPVGHPMREKVDAIRAADEVYRDTLGRIAAREKSAILKLLLPD